MAVATSTPPAEARKVTLAFTHTSISRQFSQLLGTLACAIEAERDVEHGCSQDLAFPHGLREAELLWQRVTDECSALVVSAPMRAADHAMISAARAFLDTLGAESRAEFDEATDRIACPAQSRRRAAVDAVSRRCEQMLQTAKARLVEIGTLEMIPGAELADSTDDPLPIAC